MLQKVSHYENLSLMAAEYATVIDRLSRFGVQTKRGRLAQYQSVLNEICELPDKKFESAGFNPRYRAAMAEALELVRLARLPDDFLASADSRKKLLKMGDGRFPDAAPTDRGRDITFEFVVAQHLHQAGLAPFFIPESTAKTPDIGISRPGVAFECRRINDWKSLRAKLSQARDKIAAFGGAGFAVIDVSRPMEREVPRASALTEEGFSEITHAALKASSDRELRRLPAYKRKLSAVIFHWLRAECVGSGLSVRTVNTWQWVVLDGPGYLTSIADEVYAAIDPGRQERIEP